jgi:hypothetical protein
MDITIGICTEGALITAFESLLKLIYEILYTAHQPFINGTEDADFLWSEATVAVVPRDALHENEVASSHARSSNAPRRGCLLDSWRQL